MDRLFCDQTNPEPTISDAPTHQRSMRFWPGTLLARTFFLIAALLAISLIAWVAILRGSEMTPRAQQAALQVAAIVNLSRAALVAAAPEKRPELLAALTVSEGITIWPLEADDVTGPLPDPYFAQLLDYEIKSLLGFDTQVAGVVNGRPGLWISFKIGGDGYWAAVERRRLETSPAAEWLAWATFAAMLSLAGAAWVSGRVDRPLRALATAARSLTRGVSPDPLPEDGSDEIVVVNRSFNRMVARLKASSEERSLILAGISHDLRTPLTRLRLELEMAPLSAETRAAMQDDLSVMDRIVGRFLDYARAGTESQQAQAVEVDVFLQSLAARLHHRGAQIDFAGAPGVFAWVDPEDFERALNNLAENAMRYGTNPDNGTLKMLVEVKIEKSWVLITLSDNGPGIPPEQRDAIVQPFTRGDMARGGDGGTGLGLAIVSRLIRRNGGLIKLGRSADSNGLKVSISLPSATSNTNTGHQSGA